MATKRTSKPSPITTPITMKVGAEVVQEALMDWIRDADLRKIAETLPDLTVHQLWLLDCGHAYLTGDSEKGVRFIDRRSALAKAKAKR